MTLFDHLSEPVKHTFDLLSLGAVVATMMSWLPAATIFLSFVWICLRCIESFQNVKLNHRKLRDD